MVTLKRFRVLKIALRDYLQYSSISSAVVGIKDYLRSLTAGSTGRIIALTNSVRRLNSGYFYRLAHQELLQCIEKTPEDVVHAHHLAHQLRDITGSIARTVVLKAPAMNDERGVIYCQFEYNWGRIMEGIPQLDVLLEKYDVIWGASWSPLEYLALSRLLAQTSGLIYIHPANLNEATKLRDFDARIRVVPNLASEFQDPNGHHPKISSERDIDLIVVSNWAPFKRHWELFNALRKMPPELEIVLVGQPESGYTLDDIRELARLFQVPQDIEYLQSIPLSQVHSLQSRSKAAAVFSRREGQCMAAVEALFAGASLGLRHGAQIGCAVYINSETGMFLRPHSMPTDLLQLIEGAKNRNPRQWALQHLGRDNATQHLNEWLKQQAVVRGLPWTTDIVRHWWAPYPWVGDAGSQAALIHAVTQLHANYPKLFVANLLDSSRL